MRRAFFACGSNLALASAFSEQVKSRLYWYPTHSAEHHPTDEDLSVGTPVRGMDGARKPIAKN
jgi:hypothetical protein